MHDSTAQADREKRRLTMLSLLAAVLLTSTKLGVGLWTNSLGILSEAAHSGLDLLACGVTFWAVRISGQPADREHTYGHGKFENLSALVETLFLLVASLWIVREAILRLFFHEAAGIDPDRSVWGFLVIVVAVGVNYSRSRALHRAAVKYASQALEADALHFSTDIWSSVVVLLGLCGVLAGERLAMPWLAHADAVAALGVAIIVIWVSFKLGKKAVEDLMDSVPKGLYQQVAAAVAQVPGVEQVTRLRLRRSGPQSFADVTLAVSHAAAFEQAHDVSQAVEAAIHAILPNADAVVHVEPIAPGEEDVTTVVRLLAARHGLGAHGVRIYEENGQRWLELHLEVSDRLLLEEAHQQATGFERELRKTLPGVTRIVTHIEPTGDAAAIVRSEPAGQREVQAAIAQFMKSYPRPVRPHEVRVQQAGGELSVSFHCTLDAATAITEAHELTVRLEEYLRANVPGLGRVVIHVEPGKGTS